MNTHLKYCFVALLAASAFGICAVGKSFAQAPDGAAARARITVAKTQILAFETAIDTFEVDTGKFPKTLDDLVTAPKDLPTWRGPYLKMIPLDPWNHPYLYVCPSKQRGKNYDLITYGADGKAGGGDDLTNRPITGDS